MLGRFVKLLAVVVAALAVAPSLLLLAVFVSMASGVPAPPRLYVWLGEHLDDVPPAAFFSNVDMRLVSSSIEMSRDYAFRILNVRPEARRWMSELRIQPGASREYGGWYDPTDRSLAINQPYVQVFLHEFAHANFDRKPLLERTAFAANAIRLYFDEENYPAQRRVLLQTLALAVDNAKRGQVVDVFQEIYAFIAQSSKGDLNNIPAYLRPYYADYLQPGENDWVRWLATASGS